MRLYYAQNKEDLLIESFFPDVDKGFYIDVGANDETIDSVTKIFYEKGWSGINVDPIKRFIDKLDKSRKRDINLQIGLSDKESVLSFREYPSGDGLSTFDKSMQDQYKKGGHNFPTDKYEEYDVPVQRLQDVIKENKIEHIHFLKIDVEGYEGEVIAGNDWAKYRPELLCIEANHIHADWKTILKQNDYEEVFFDGINSYFLAKESIHRKEYFDYPKAVFAGNPVYYQAYRELQDPLTEEIKQLTAFNVQQTELINEQRATINEIETRLSSFKFLIKRITSEIRKRVHTKANLTQTDPFPVYKSDAEIKQLVQSGNLPKSTALEYVQAKDSKNIYLPKKGTTSLVLVFWKATDGVFTALAKLARKVLKG